MKAYRCGSMYRSAHRFSVKQFNDFFDRVAPTGRVLRSEAIYTSPVRHGLASWIPVKERRRERRMSYPVGSVFRQFDHDTLIRHVDLAVGDDLFVYDSMLYEELLTEASEKRFDNDRVDASLYWESGVPLARWLELFSTDLDERVVSSELLIAPRHVQRVTIESTGEVEAFDPLHESLLGATPKLAS